MFELLKPSTPNDCPPTTAVASDALTMGEFWLLASAFASLLTSVAFTAINF